ncbi:MAG TPA: hypothetical protein VFL90_12350 [Methylomirabilota bacterium]|nr:hypothetical protein [Methylomirabilota bacterium]
MQRREGLAKVEEEIRREKAAALGRAGERLEAALAATDALGRALDAESDPGRRAALLEDYEAARRRASHARTMLLIQREAIGLRQHRDVDRTFPEPPRRR